MLALACAGKLRGDECEGVCFVCACARECVSVRVCLCMRASIYAYMGVWLLFMGR